jgi:hypothetical protein
MNKLSLLSAGAGLLAALASTTQTATAQSTLELVKNERGPLHCSRERGVGSAVAYDDLDPVP